MNYEFLQVAKMCVEIPDTTLFEPYIRFRVWETPDPSSRLEKLLYNPVLIGESLQTLANQLPCCWIKGVDTSKPFDEQKKDIENQIKILQAAAAVKDSFEETSA